MRLKGIVEVDHVNYKKLSMFLSFPDCTFKCEKDCGAEVCQNSLLARSQDFDVKKEYIIEEYLRNPLTEAIVIGGLEPFDTDLDLVTFIDCVRRQYDCKDDIVIYTGYTEEELERGWRDSDGKAFETRATLYQQLKKFRNVIVKFGRFVPGDTTHYDDILGVELASRNQYAKILEDK